MKGVGMTKTLTLKRGGLALLAGTLLTLSAGFTVRAAPATIGMVAEPTELDEGDYLPLERVQPKYPKRAFDEGIGGYVVLELTVNKDGSVLADSIKVVEASPEGVFENVSKAAAEQFHYKPKKVGGVPHPVSGVRYKFSFSLNE